MNKPVLSVGMASYNDYEGVWSTIQALRLYQDTSDTEILVIDNYGCQATQNFCQEWAKVRYIRMDEPKGTAPPRNRIFEEARGEYVLVIDCHVFLYSPCALYWLRNYYDTFSNTKDLLQGPLVYDDLTNQSTHMESIWGAAMLGQWSTPRPIDDAYNHEVREIQFHGLGLFSCKKSEWPGFSPLFRGFGGEEAYIHQKIRNRGGRVLCLPWLKWVHRFYRQGTQAKYDLGIEDRAFNYFIGHLELGWSTQPVHQHFQQWIEKEKLRYLEDEACLALTIGRPALLPKQVSVSLGEPAPASPQPIAPTADPF